MSGQTCDVAYRHLSNLSYQPDGVGSSGKADMVQERAKDRFAGNPKRAFVNAGCP
jgi:hypothetical protein